MTRLNILLINHYAGSVLHGMEFRPFYLAREWVRLGHRVRIVASSQSHIRARAPDMKGRSQLDQNIEGVDYTWYATTPYRGNGVGRFANILNFIYRLYFEGSRLAREVRPDVVIASSTYPLDIWPAHRIARLSGARLLFELHDLWPLSPMELGGYSRWHPFIILLQAAEDYACRHADAIVSILPKVREHLEAHGMAPDKLHIVPNGADPDEWLLNAPGLGAQVERVLAEAREKAECIVGYTGSHGLANALDTLLEASSLLRGEPVAFLLVGGGPRKVLLQARAREMGLSNVYFLDPVLKHQIPALLRQFDFAYMGWQRQPLYRFGIAPNKLIDYMMAARPVVHAVEAGNDPVAEAGCGITVPPEDPHALAAAILCLACKSGVERDQMGQRGMRYALANLTYPVLGQRFLCACRGY